MSGLSPLDSDDSELQRGLRALLDRRLLVFLGKGGVGKSTLAAATGRLLATRGKRVLLCEVNAKDRLPALLGVKPVGPQIAQVGENLFLCNIQPEPALHDYAVMKLKVERVVTKLLGNKLVHYFLHLLPSLAETVTLGKLLFHVREEQNGQKRFDTVILDAPATGHGLALLRLPQVLLPSIPAGPLREDMEWMNALLVDPAITAVQLVTLAEELPVNETLEMSATLRDTLRLPRGLCFANGLWPSRFDADELTTLREKVPEGVFAMTERLQAQADINRAQLTRLREQIDLPVVDLPQLFAEADGPAVVARTQDVLAALLKAAAPLTTHG